MFLSIRYPLPAVAAAFKGGASKQATGGRARFTTHDSRELLASQTRYDATVAAWKRRRSKDMYYDPSGGLSNTWGRYSASPYVFDMFNKIQLVTS